ncbi:hypothetical protein RHGRI_038561 [Rhododendron griersonianum]|uniref:Protein kinase domain-containing protein n=1 Tax=Rhododendron griersonianum TaxID=479676 RepID=A0AAV6HPG6_9ERIC|nr:hypothetical protein RHGRI_038561 [Rhododendron griersonianum]
MLKEFEACPCVVRCYGSDTSIERGEEWYNLFLEYASGGSLFDRIRESGGSLPEDEARRYTKSVLAGLSYIHEKGYVHCDIKPHNILVVENGRETTAKIADFGLAMKPKEEKIKGVRGTPMYMALESIRREEYGPCADIWAVGCTVLEMVTGKEPWECGRHIEKAALLYRIASKQDVPEIPSWLSNEARDFLSKCLVRSRSQVKVDCQYAVRPSLCFRCQERIYGNYSR